VLRVKLLDLFLIKVDVTVASHAFSHVSLRIIETPSCIDGLGRKLNARLIWSEICIRKVHRLYVLLLQILNHIHMATVDTLESI
jgi:hypothetical protein